MHNLQDLKQWMKEIRFVNGNSFDMISDTSNEHGDIKFYIYTDNNKYSIVANCHESGSTYLGCQANSRKSRAGENWHRGSDLSDGKLSPRTWRKILSDIVGYELVKVHFKAAVTENTERFTGPKYNAITQGIDGKSVFPL